MNAGRAVFTPAHAHWPWVAEVLLPGFFFFLAKYLFFANLEGTLGTALHKHCFRERDLLSALAPSVSLVRSCLTSWVSIFPTWSLWAPPGPKSSFR